MFTRGKAAESTENTTAAGNSDKGIAGMMSAPRSAVPPKLPAAEPLAAKPPAKELEVRPKPAGNGMSRDGSTAMLATGGRALSVSHSASRVIPAATAELGRRADDEQDGASP